MNTYSEERFWSKVEKSGPPSERRPDLGRCWIWLGTHNPVNGYGQFAIRGDQYAHRISYRLLIGPIPIGLEIDHLCGVRDCCNPGHLEAVTHAENCRRAGPWIAATSHQKKKTHCPQGHPYDAENTRLAFGRRYCIKCNIERCRAWRQERRAVAS